MVYYIVVHLSHIIMSGSSVDSKIVGGFFDDIIAVFLRVFSNPVTLVLFIVGVLEVFSLLVDSPNSVYVFIIKNLKDLLADDPPKFTVSIINAFINIFTYLSGHRRFFLPLYFILIPLILGERDFITSLIFWAIIFIFRSFSVLQVFIVCLSWVSYNSFTNLHKFVFILIVLVFIYFDMFSGFSEGASLYKSIRQSLV